LSWCAGQGLRQAQPERTEKLLPIRSP
jgi:hypothetical protein